MANVIKHKRGSGSDPSASDLVVGEVAIRTDVGKLFTKMDNGSVSEIAGGGSDIIINTLSSSSATGGGSATFNGSAYRFTLSSPPSVSAQQLLVSINGVIQKPVAGTGQPSEGFSVDGTDIILGDAPATGADFFILTFKSLGVSEPADNSVTSAKIADGAIVNADINASAAIAGSKISPTFTSNIEISNSVPTLVFNDTDHENDFEIKNYNGTLIVTDKDAGANRIELASDGTVDITGNLDVGAGIDVTGVTTTTGRVNIGDTQMSSNLLNVEDGTAAAIDIASHGSGGDTAYIGVKKSTGGGLTLGISNRDIIFKTGATYNNGTTFDSGTERMRIDSSGRVGIGCTPTAQFNHNLIQIGNQATLGANAALSSTGQTFLTHNLYYDTGGTLKVFNTSNANEGAIIQIREAYFAFSNSAATTGTPTVTERFRIDSSGNVGIGTTSPSTLLHVSTTADGTTDLLTLHADSDGSNNGIASIKFTGNTGNHASFIKGGHTTNGDSILTFHTDAHASGINPEERMRIDSSGAVRIAHTSFTADTSADDLIVGSTNSGINRGITILNHTGADGRLCFAQSGDPDAGMIKYSHGSDVMQFFVESSERMRIDSSGNKILDSTFDVSSTSNRRSYFTSNGQQFHARNQHEAFIVFQKLDGTQIGSIARTVSNVAYNTSSDYRLKENISGISDGITRLKQLKPSRFNFISDPDITMDGFIAHEVSSVVPEAIEGEKDGAITQAMLDAGTLQGTVGDPIYQQIDQSKLVPLLVAALQEAVARIEALEAG
jgi:hypothetical protein